MRPTLLPQQGVAAKQPEGACGQGHVGGAGAALLLQQRFRSSSA